MRWLKRVFWLSAWGVWLALGVGLHWQLPRVVGPKVCEIQLADSDKIVGFVRGSHELLVQPKRFARPIMLKVYDANTGSRSRDLLLDDRLPQLPLTTSRSHGVVVA